MEVEYEHEDDVEIECPHCKKTFTYHYKGSGCTEIEPQYNEGYD
jgi:transposase-like protein